MKLGTVYGINAEGESRHIKTAEVGEVLQIWKKRNPSQFVKIGYFTDTGARRLRNVNPSKPDPVKSEPAKNKSTK